MTETRNDSPRRLMCSVFSKSNQEDPGGSGSWWKRCVVFEMTKPWESDIAKTPHFPSGLSDVLERANQSGLETKVHCVVPDSEYTAAGRSRVMFFSRPEGPFSTYSKDDFQVPPDKIVPLVEALVDSPKRLEDFERYRQDTSGVRDILVCTHGSHDCCCATFGYPIYQVLRRQHAPELNGALRVWRVSHLGGHRFAPNLLDMPEGRNWVRIGHEDLESLVHRNRPASELRQSYRGWVGLDSPYEQVAEREAFMREGWDWTRRRISGQLTAVEGDGDQAEVRIDYSDAEGGDYGAYEVTVKSIESVAKVECLSGEDTGAATQFKATRVVKVS